MDDGSIRGTVRYAHPGHDRIARESMDLRQREDELRGRWREMGFQLPQVCSDNETPFTLPEPISVDQHDTVTTHHHQQQHQQVLESRDHSDWPADATHTQTNGVRHAVHTSSRPSSVKVRPHEEEGPGDEEADHRRVWSGRGGYSPADETPIQREIRLNAEREQLLRQSRGLPVVCSHSTSPQGSSRRPVAVAHTDNADDIHHTTSNGGDTSIPHSGVSMRQLACSRLALELEREKQRELDLRRLGCISTISEERRPHDARTPHAAAAAAGCHDNGDVTGGAGTWLVEREVQLAQQRELELQMQRARLSTSSWNGGVTSPDSDVIHRNATTS